MIYAIIICAVAIVAGIVITRHEKAKRNTGTGNGKIKPPGSSEAK